MVRGEESGMKKRGAALLFCLLLVLQLALPVRAAGSVYFVAAEASVLPLTDAVLVRRLSLCTGVGVHRL